MCEMFGLSSSKRVKLNRYLAELFSHSVDHPHGWGMATFFGNAVNLEKEPMAAWMSSYLQSRIKHNIEAENMIAHIRLATRGHMVYENCHPFVKRDLNERPWTLAHNGTVFRSEIIDRYACAQEGCTDSEKVLYHIIHRANQLIEEGDEFGEFQRFKMLDSIIKELSMNNKLNLLIYDGELLYVHTNMKNTLYYLQKDGSIMFSTVPLGEHLWNHVPLMQLIACKDGEIVFEGEKHNNEYVAENTTVPSYDYASL